MAGRAGTALVIVTLSLIFAALFVVEDLHLVARPVTSRRILTQLGYTEITITGVHPLACASGEPFRTGFGARSPGGSLVRGTVCQGWFKGATVRLR